MSLGLCAPAAAAPITVPTSLNPGDEYRLAFVTWEERNGASSNIASYNTFVTGVANTQPALASLGTTWKAIGSTATVDARDNTGTNPVVDGVGVPIFLLNDTLLANDNLDLWDGSILVPLEIDEAGSAIPQSFVWTGTTSSGVARGPLALGAGVGSDVGIGLTAATSTSWVSGADLFNFLDQPVYALSDVLVVPTPAPLSRSQQACVNEMNKNGEKVNKAQLKENEWCLKNFQSEKLDPPATFDQCLTEDRRGKVQKAMEKTATGEDKKCDPLNPPPAFAYTDSATVNAAAMDGGLWMNYEIFGGPPVSDSDLFTNADNKDTARCQLEMLKRADKLENTVLKQINKAKKQALKDESVDSKAALEAKLAAVLSSNSKIVKAEEKLVTKVDKKCAALQASPSTIFPGSCADSSLSAVEDCVIAVARCEACLKINAFDDLDLDCDQADDQNANGSCP